MALRVGTEDMVFTLPDAMKHTLDHANAFYFMDETELVIFDFVEEVLAINLLDEYLKKLANKERQEKASILQPVQHVSYVEENT